LRRLPSSAPAPAPIIAEEVAGTVARTLRSELTVALAELKSELRIELRTVLRQLGDEQSELSQQVAASQAQLRRLQEDLAELAEIRADQQRHDEQRLQAELSEVAAEVAVIRRRLPANLRQVTSLDDAQVAAMIDAIVTAIEPVIAASREQPRRRRPVAARSPEPAEPASGEADEG
jgi:chromosome segregation ATPase